jgi:hypothetical protein
MAARERHRPRPGCDGPPDDGDLTGGLDRARRAGEEFLAAGDEAIRRALSGDSEAFLRSSRQRGGQ